MRLKELKIKDFRSIKKTDLSLLDLDVTTLIGANGSGKSNLLKAIASLKGDNTTPSDDDFHAKDPSVDGEIISIVATFVFENKDLHLLQKTGLQNKGLTGFTVMVEKVFGQEPTIEYKGIGFKDSRLEDVEILKKEILSQFKKIEVDESFKEVQNSLIKKIQDDVIYREDINSVVDVIVTQFEQFKGINGEISDKILKSFNEMKLISTNDPTEKLGEIFSNLNIEILQPNSYTIENNAPLSELQDRIKHPFLYDLLLLTGKNSKDFTVKGTALPRIKDFASNKLSSAVSNVWLSHDLKFQIDKEGENLEFMVFTPQGHQVSLTDLSDGEQWFLKFYLRLAIAQRENKQIIWLFDEPGRDLHTASQMDLKAFFEEISKEAQVVYTSHLAMMIPWHRLERIFAVENSKDEGTIVHKRFWKDTKLDSPLKDALSTFVGEDLLGGKEHVIIEGISDYFYLQGWLQFLKKESPIPLGVSNYGLFNRIMVPVDGIEKIPLYCWFLGREVKNKINWVVVVDSAAESASTSKKMTDTGLGSWTKNIRSIGELAGKKTGIEEIEGLFKKEEYISLFIEFYTQNHLSCILPTQEEIIERNKTVTKISKAIEELLVEKNPEIKINGNNISLDKTGISQYMYKCLSETGNTRFSKETEIKFTKIFEAIEKTFSNTVLEEKV